MERFIELYTKKDSEKTEEFMQLGIQLIKSKIRPDQKGYIFEKLKEVFPNDPAVYYYIGFELKEINKEAAFECFSASFQINPKNIENMIELFSSCIKKDLHKSVIKMIEKHELLTPENLADWRFLCLYYDCLRKISNIKCLQYIKKAMNILEKKKIKTKEESMAYHSAFVHMVDIIVNLSNSEIVPKLIEKHLLMIMKDRTIENKVIFQCLSTYLFISNFVYEIDISDVFTDLYRKRFMTTHQIFDKKSSPNIPIEIFRALNVTCNNKAFIINTPTKTKKIRIGYLSSDFTNHAVSNFILPIIEYHTDMFDIYLFSMSNDNEDIMQYNYYNVNDMEDENIANLIQELRIDILFDLNGNTSGNKMSVFTYKPAPICISYIGCPVTTGMLCMDYFITDSITDKVDTPQLFTETLLRMPRFHLLYKPIIKSVKYTEKEPNTILLGALNKEGKTNKLVLNTWKTILKRCPIAMMLIRLDLQGDMDERIEFYVKNLDCNRERLLFVANLDDEEYFGLFKKIDLLLDTFPYSGTTTSCNSLFHSTPIVTMYKKGIHAHNMTSSLLINMGFPELVTHSTEGYIEKAVELIESPEKIGTYKTTISDTFLELMEPHRFIKEYEGLIMNMYQEYHEKICVSIMSEPK